MLLCRRLIVGIVLKLADIPGNTPQWWFLDISILMIAILFAQVKAGCVLNEERNK